MFFWGSPADEFYWMMTSLFENDGRSVTDKKKSRLSGTHEHPLFSSADIAEWGQEEYEE